MSLLFIVNYKISVTIMTNQNAYLALSHTQICTHMHKCAYMQIPRPIYLTFCAAIYLFNEKYHLLPALSQHKQEPNYFGIINVIAIL